MKTKVESEYHNRTDFTEKQIAEFPVIVTITNRWRARHVVVHEHPTDPEQVLSVGKSFDGRLTVICQESRSDYAFELSLGKKHIETH